MDGRTDEWMDGWMNEWMNGINEWSVGWLVGWTDGRMSEWMNKWMNERRSEHTSVNEWNEMNEWMGRWKDERRWMNGWMGRWKDERRWMNGWMERSIRTTKGQQKDTSAKFAAFTSRTFTISTPDLRFLRTSQQRCQSDLTWIMRLAKASDPRISNNLQQRLCSVRTLYWVNSWYFLGDGVPCLLFMVRHVTLYVTWWKGGIGKTQTRLSDF